MSTTRINLYLPTEVRDKVNKVRRLYGETLSEFTRQALIAHCRAKTEQHKRDQEL